jgi:hypothetical protein
VNTLDLLRARVSGELLKHLPTLPGWFSEASLTTGTLSKLLGAFTVQVADWLAAIKVVKDGVYLDDATGDALDQWRKDLNQPLIDGETEAALRQRLKGAILRLRLTREGVRSYVAELTGLPTEVLLPWKDIDWRGQRDTTLAFGAQDHVNGRSGRRRRSSPYYQGGVIDLRTQGSNPQLEKLALDSVAAGVQVYLTSYNAAAPVTAGDNSPLGAFSEIDLEGRLLPGSGFQKTVRSGRYPRSGRRVLSAFSEIDVEGQTGPVPLCLDGGALDPGASFWNMAYCMADLADLTWDQVTHQLIHLERQPSGERRTEGAQNVSVLSGGTLLTLGYDRILQDG